MPARSHTSPDPVGQAQNFEPYYVLDERAGYHKGSRALVYHQPPDDEGATSATIRLMFLISEADSTSPLIRAATAGAIARAQDEADKIASIFAWVKATVVFREDRNSDWLARIPASTELLVHPTETLLMAQPTGDCDDFSMLTAAMLYAAGIEPAFKTIAAEKHNPNYSHVFCVAILSDGEAVALDTSNGAGPGWEARPAGKSKIWRREMLKLDRPGSDASGFRPGEKQYNPYSDPTTNLYDPAADWRNYEVAGGDAGGPAADDNTNEHGRKNMGYVSGLGSDVADLNPGQSGYDPITDPTSSLYQASQDWRNYGDNNNYVGPATGVDWASVTKLLAPLTTGANNILKTVYQSQPGTYTRAADGSITYRAPVGGSMSLPTGLSTSSISPMYLIGGGLLLLVLLMKK